jgi:hypothetical protein
LAELSQKRCPLSQELSAIRVPLNQTAQHLDCLLDVTRLAVGSHDALWQQLFLGVQLKGASQHIANLLVLTSFCVAGDQRLPAFDVGGVPEYAKFKRSLDAF